MDSVDSILARFAPSPSAALTSLFRMTNERTLEEIAMADGGWGYEETLEVLRLLRDEDRFEASFDSQVLENLSLFAWSWKEGTTVIPDAAACALACAVFIRLSGEAPPWSMDFTGLGSSHLAQLLACSLILPAPLLAQISALIAWRLQPSLPPVEEAEMPFLWLGLLVASATGRMPIADPAVVKRIASEVLASWTRAEQVHASLLDATPLADRWRSWLRRVVIPAAAQDEDLSLIVWEIRDRAEHRRRHDR